MRSFQPSLHPLLAGLIAALAAIVPAAAWAQAGPTLTFDKPCYAEGDPMTFAGTGFTPNGEINFVFNSLSTQQKGTYDTRADGTGAIGDYVDAPPEDLYQLAARRLRGLAQALREVA